MQLIDLESHPDNELSDITDKIVQAANERPELQGVNTTFSVTSPSYKYELDQKKIEMLGVNLADVYSGMVWTISRRTKSLRLDRASYGFGVGFRLFMPRRAV